MRCFRSLEDYWRRGSFVMRIDLTGSQTALLCGYIDSSLKSAGGKLVTVSRNFMSGGAFYDPASDITRSTPATPGSPGR